MSLPTFLARAVLGPLVVSLGLGSSAALGQSVERGIGMYDRPGGAKQSRSVTYARHGMAATSDVRATQAAVDILRAGGSAVDAAIAANAVLGVVEPMSCGIGGDLFALCWSPQDGKLRGLNASGRAPRAATISSLRRRGLKQVPMYGPLSWTVPGCVDGWRALHQEYGKLPWSRLFEPAITLAEEGFPVAPVIAEYWRAAEGRLRDDRLAAETYLVDGHAPRAGDIFRNARLAETYRRIASQGAEVFYQGEIARQIDRYSRSTGEGLLRLEDLAAHRSHWVVPVSTKYRGLDVWELPPNGQGIAVLQMLNMLEPFDIAAMGWGSPEWVHLFVETKKLVFADRARWYADMAMVDVPLSQLISREYAETRRRLIDPARAATHVAAGDPRLVHGDTVYLCVVDADRCCCSLIQSNFHGFGSQLVAGELGFALQNRGALFSLDPEHPNCLAPGKRPFHTIIPAMVTREGRPLLVFGVMGGDMQPQGQVQVLVNWIDFGMNIQLAGDAARVRHDGSPSPTGEAGQEGGGTVMVESGIPEETIIALRERGHRVGKGGSFGGYQAILIDWERGVLEGATEARKDGAALGY
ncbi:MAG: gamma-glutamyltransferase [Pirellulaceae bacterium]|nr:MAG: gamma-glutamyltransferase [Pirellulaceae bacterium]